MIYQWRRRFSTIHLWWYESHTFQTIFKILICIHNSELLTIPKGLFQTEWHNWQNGNSNTLNIILSPVSSNQLFTISGHTKMRWNCQWVVGRASYSIHKYLLYVHNTYALRLSHHSGWLPFDLFVTDSSCRRITLNFMFIKFFMWKKLWSIHLNESPSRGHFPLDDYFQKWIQFKTVRMNKFNRLRALCHVARPSFEEAVIETKGESQKRKEKWIITPQFLCVCVKNKA